MINGHTQFIAHVGYPTGTFKSPMIYNPWFEKHGVNAVVVPMGVQSPDYADCLRALFRMTNICGALVTMPHKVVTMDLVDEVTPTAAIAGACNAVRRLPDGRLLGDQFDGEGFVRGVRRKGLKLAGAKALVSGNGGVGCAIAASLAAAGVGELMLFDANTAASEGLADRLRQHYPQLVVRTGDKDPAGYDLIVNATPLGMNAGDPLPFDVDRIAPTTMVGEVVMKHEFTPLLEAAVAKGCPYQLGTDMLFEMIPAYLEFFGLGTTSAEELREVARISYS